MKKDEPPVPRSTKQYHEGRRAYLRGGDGECPYPISDFRRVGWFTGWLDARTEKRLPHIFGTEETILARIGRTERELRLLLNRCIWGGSGEIYLGELKLAYRLTYTTIEIVKNYRRVILEDRKRAK